MRNAALSILAVLLPFVPTLRAQTSCHAENDGPGFNDAVSMGGSMVGIKFTAPASIAVDRIELFTGEAGGVNTVGLWDHDATNNEPGTVIASGSWNLASANGFQGASLAPAVALSSGTVFWLVWTPTGGAQAAVDVPMTTLGQQYRGSFDGGMSWSGPFQFVDRHWKFRLIGNCGAVTLYCAGDGTLSIACPCGVNGTSGRGCDNSAGTGGALLTTSGATIPDTLVLTSSGELPSAPTVFLQGEASLTSPVVFGDGVRCVGGTLKFLYVKFASGGTAVAPVAGDPSITSQSAALGNPIVAGTTRWYQAMYRDPNLAFCPAPAGNTWNVSSGVAVAW